MRRMTLENVFGVSDERVIDTVKPRPRRVKLPWWAIIPPALAAALVVARGYGALPDEQGLEWLLLAVGGLGAAIFATRLEERAFAAMREASTGVRLALGAAVVLGGFGGATLLAAQIVLLPAWGVRLMLLPFGAILWIASAAFGGLVLMVIDTVLRALIADFRRRIVFTVLFLLGLAIALFGWVAVRSVALLEAMASEGAAPPQLFDYSLRDLPFAEPLLAKPTLFALAAILGAGIVTLPAILSACAKLAESVTERINPLLTAFERVAQGDRSVHLEEAGGDQFFTLAVSFNEMIDKLYLGQRMERAFGQYVSKEVLDRVRAQKGAVRLPAELRHASVFFADIRGFTPLSERLAPELVVGLLNRYLEQVVPLVEEHQGFLNKFVGDAVVVVFNGPLEQPDHAARACTCAIALQNLIARLNGEGYFAEAGELQIGVGVATGPMLCGNIGTRSRLEYTVIGDTVNLASRMTGHAHGGEVWVSEATARELPPQLPALAAPPIKFKGKDNAVVPFRVWPPPAPGVAPTPGRA